MFLILDNPIIEEIIELIVLILEIIAVAIISVTIIAALIRFIRSILKRNTTDICIKEFKRIITVGIEFALEILIAADIISTVLLDDSLANLSTIALLVLIRSFISWELYFEREGRWPFQKPEKTE